jgi:hypothetical protein
MRFYFFYVVMSFCLLSCVGSPDYSAIPNITNITLSKNQMNQSNIFEDSITLTIEFTDGDGDFGSASTSNENNIFVIDNRTSLLNDAFKAPFIPTQGSGNGVAGKIFIKMYSTCCITDNNPSCCFDNFGCPQSNDLTYSVYIKDRAGNQSNTVITPNITLICN